jgi:hypothetical protein
MLLLASYALPHPQLPPCYFLLLKLSPSLKALLLQLYYSLEAPSFQNLSKTQKWCRLKCWSLISSSIGGKARSACAELPCWMVDAPKENRVVEAHYGPRQLFIRVRPPTRMSDAFRRSGLWANERAQRQEPLGCKDIPPPTQRRSLIGTFPFRRPNRDFS